MAGWAASALHPDVHLVTDGFSSFAADGVVLADYGSIIVSPRKSSDLEVFRWFNTYIADMKTANHGTYHHFDFHKYCSC